MNRRGFLASLGGLVIAGPSALEALERMNWKRRFFPSAAIPTPWQTARFMRARFWVDPIEMTQLGSATKVYEPGQKHLALEVSHDNAHWSLIPATDVTIDTTHFRDGRHTPRYFVRPRDGQGPVLQFA